MNVVIFNFTTHSVQFCNYLSDFNCFQTKQSYLPIVGFYYNFIIVIFMQYYGLIIRPSDQTVGRPPAAPGQDSNLGRWSIGRDTNE